MKTNTSRISAVFMALVLALSFLAVSVSAQETDVSEEIEVEDAGVTPDSPLHGLDRALDRINLALTFNKQKKAEKALRIAEERLSEAEEMAEEGKLDEAAEAEEEHNELVDEAEFAVEEIESNGDEETAKESLEEVLKVKHKIASHSEKVSLVKQRILERQAERMSPEQLAKLRAVFERIENKALETENKINQKKENVKTRLKVLTEKTDEEIDEVESEIEEETGLDKEKKERTAREIKRAEKSLENLERKLKEQNVSDAEIDDAIKKVREKIKEAKEDEQEGEYEEAEDVAEEVKEFGNEFSLIATSLREARESGNFEERLRELKEAAHNRRAEALARSEEIRAELAEEKAEREIRLRESIRTAREIKKSDDSDDSTDSDSETKDSSGSSTETAKIAPIRA